MKNKFLYTALIISYAMLTSSCKNKQETGNDPVVSQKQSGDTVIIGTGSPLKNKITVQNVSFQKCNYTFTTTGVVRPLTGQLAQISTPFEGRIMSSYVRLGERISKGAPVFGIASQDYFEAVRNLQQAAKEKETAGRNFNRKKELLDQGVASRKDYEDASLALDITQKEYEKACASLKIFNINPENADFTHPLIITSPIAGEVVSMNITLGQYIKSDSEPVVVVANLDRVWVVAHVKEKDLGKINLKDEVDIVTENFPDRPIGGTVEYIGGIMEDQTRSVEVFIECANPDRIIKPGMFVTVHFKHLIENAVIIPSSALLQEEDRTFVFVKLSENAYLKRTVNAVSLDNRQMLINSGLGKGDEFVSDGGIYLR